MLKRHCLLGGIFIATALVVQPASALSKPVDEYQIGDASGGSGGMYSLTPNGQGLQVVHQALYAHLLKSETFVRLQSLVEYVWYKHQQRYK
ncbi:MAG TPA: hypothetical protein PLE99_16045 [Candidatus Thiothrix moscowensis]|uniref:hypothetical protein n=1 Tax=unclassified Thiothrix TaxID=2636184 RepID=UPI0025EFCC70|nr:MULTISPECIES: hypothetical protein [unclassified Thiothrix]HRJ54272.1 hypothetical protein [Candidatus Thiothrix moscowensis]HRJ94540.1 hypothetical protein [Candidatus Thiothrix moscowensis]